MRGLGPWFKMAVAPDDPSLNERRVASDRDEDYSSACHLSRLTYH
jgi:hypothetical protein